MQSETFFEKLSDICWRVIKAIALFCLHLLFKIIRKPPTREADAAFLQFVKFGIVGFSSTVVSYLLYSGSLLLIRRVSRDISYDYMIAQIIAFVLSVLWSFYWNNKYVFSLKGGEQRSLWKSLLKTYISYSFTGLFLNTILLYLWVDILGINEFIAPLINLIVSVPINFFMNKFWAFRKTKG